jgi:hypothetical protein
MNKISSADVRRLLTLLFLKARLKVCLFAGFGSHLLSLRFISLCLASRNRPSTCGVVRVRWQQELGLRRCWLPHDLHVALHRLCQLGIHFVGNRHNIGQ